ncbi:neuropeptide-like 3 [Nylanderia fulva]|uniref:neuropeptide-like 3 n=1 Tax=Nylanderia fulva TaxID=613905 RepID=UPI0010FBA201|nr:neuropeptide-like 3 [Nylanderia fulva]
MFKLLCLFAILAFAAAAPAPAPAPAPGAIIAGAPLVTSYSAPIVSAPLTYSSYGLPAYSAYSAIPALPYAYKSYAALPYVL